ncbi:hypothetical protein EIP86_007172 [Pleurotus ostreatoroseus]|nr:hypothetical protein EIP86_007172 [Pleurotus ostreatoroseus]
MGAAADVYAQELGIKNYGRPLWCPEPADGYEVRIGDVGFVDEDGQFHRLFNATVGPDHPYNQHGVPNDFFPLSFLPQLLNIRRDHLQPGPISSNSVNSYHIGGSVSAVASSQLAYKFDCSTSQGAVLVLTDSAKKTYVLPSKSFTTYMGRYHASWYEFATNPDTYGLMLRPEDIVLVRGTIKTSAWALGAYVDNGNNVRGVSFTAQAGQVAGAAFEWSFSNQISSQFEHRIGGYLKTRAVLSPRPTLEEGRAHEPELPEILAERQQGIITDPESPADQCVFLSYYKVKYRLGFLKKIAANAGPADLPDDREQSPGVWVDSESGSISSEIPEPLKYRTLVDDILDYILDATDANVAIASDDDVAKILQEIDMPADFPGYLRGNNIGIKIDEHGMDTDVRMSDDDDVYGKDMAPISPTSTLVSSYDDQKLNPSTLENLARGSSNLRGGCWYVMSGFLLDTLSHLDLTGHVVCVRCDEEMVKGNSCKICRRLGIECLGWSPKRPGWMRNKDQVALYKADIKKQLSRAAHIRGLPRQTVDLPTSDKTASGSQEASGSDVTSNTAFDEADWRGWELNMSALGESPGHDYDKLTVKPPPIAAPADLLQNVREHVLYYFQHVRQLHFVLASNTVSQILYEIVAAELDGTVVYAISAIAALHSTRVAYGPDSSMHSPEVQVLHAHFFDHARKLLAGSSERQYSETDAIAAIYLIAYEQNLGSGSSWLSSLKIASGWLGQTGLLTEQDPKRQLLGMTPRQRFAAKATMWADLMSSIVFVHPPRFLAVYRRLFDDRDAVEQVPWTQPELRMDRLVGCPNEVFLAMAEIASLARWKEDQVAQGTLSTLELVRRHEVIKTILDQSHQRPVQSYVEPPAKEITLVSTMPTVANITDPSEAQLPVVTKIYREAAMLYLRTVVSDSNPDIPEITQSVNTILDTIQSIPPGDFDRACIFPIVLAGCMAPTPSLRDMLRSRCSLHNDANIGGSFVQALAVIQRMWERREAAQAAQPGVDIDWRDIVRESWSSLFIV